MKRLGTYKHYYIAGFIIALIIAQFGVVRYQHTHEVRNLCQLIEPDGAIIVHESSFSMLPCIVYIGHKDQQFLLTQVSKKALETAGMTAIRMQNIITSTEQLPESKKIYYLQSEFDYFPGHDKFLVMGESGINLYLIEE